MTIREIIRSRNPNRVTRAHAWRVEPLESDPFVGQEYALWHYSTRMLHWIDAPNGAVILSLSLGHGSVSDQNGMNTAFRVLNLPYYYSRRHGAGIKYHGDTPFTLDDVIGEVN